MGARANSAPKQRAPVITLPKYSFQICICFNFLIVF
jgi:hypothetical protein